MGICRTKTKPKTKHAIYVAQKSTKSKKFKKYISLKERKAATLSPQSKYVY